MSSIKQKRHKKFILAILPLHNYTVSGASMYPTLHSGQRVLVNRCAYLFRAPQRKDIIAFYDPRDQKILIKRIISIKNARFFVQGDNTRSSTDSRKFGMIEKKDIIGKVFFIS